MKELINSDLLKLIVNFSKENNFDCDEIITKFYIEYIESDIKKNGCQISYVVQKRYFDEMILTLKN